MKLYRDFKKIKFQKPPNLKARFNWRNLSFEPTDDPCKKSLFYGYSSQIVDYEIIVAGHEYTNKK